ncbi:MAG TPA: hypothetical protein ENI11_06230 [Actinobacteria bacterium]|nr:hypothetical protein [Actinomycetota bacterium]
MHKHLAELNAAGWDIDEEGYYFEMAEPKDPSEAPAPEQSRGALADPTELYGHLAEIASDDFIHRENVLGYLEKLGVLEVCDVRTGRTVLDVHPVSFTVLRGMINLLFNIADAYKKELLNADES